MRLRFVSGIILATSLNVRADECGDFCVAQLGRDACSKGSWCKRGHDCHSLFWTSAEKTSICVYGGSGGPCRNTHPVLCREAAAGLGAQATTAAPEPVRTSSTTTTTTVAPDIGNSLGQGAIGDYFDGSEEDLMALLAEQDFDFVAETTASPTTTTTTTTPGTRGRPVIPPYIPPVYPDPYQAWGPQLGGDCNRVIGAETQAVNRIIEEQEAIIMGVTDVSGEDAFVQESVEQATQAIMTRLNAARTAITDACLGSYRGPEAINELEGSVVRRTSEYPRMFSAWVNGRQLVQDAAARAEQVLERDFVGASDTQAIAFHRDSMRTVDDNMADLRTTLGYAWTNRFRTRLQQLSEAVEELRGRMNAARDAAVEAWRAGADERELDRLERLEIIREQNENTIQAVFADALDESLRTILGEIPRAERAEQLAELVQQFAENVRRHIAAARHSAARLEQTESLRAILAAATESVGVAHTRVETANRCMLALIQAFQMQRTLIDARITAEYSAGLNAALVSADPEREHEAFIVSKQDEVLRTMIAPAADAIRQALAGCPAEFSEIARARVGNLPQFISSVVERIVFSARAEPIFPLRVVEAQTLRELSAQETKEGADKVVAAGVKQLEALASVNLGVLGPAAREMVATIRALRTEMDASLVSLNAAEECRAALLVAIAAQKQEIIGQLERQCLDNAKGHPDDLERAVNSAKAFVIRRFMSGSALSIRTAAHDCTETDKADAEEQIEKLEALLDARAVGILEELTAVRDQRRAALEQGKQQLLARVAETLRVGLNAFESSIPSASTRVEAEATLRHLTESVGPVTEDLAAAIAGEFAVFADQLQARSAEVRREVERCRRVTQDKVEQIQKDAKRRQERLRELQQAMQPFSLDLVSAVHRAVDAMTDSASEPSISAEESIAQAREGINVALVQFHQALTVEMRTDLADAIAKQENVVAETLAGLAETRQRAVACVANLNRVTDEQVAFVTRFIKTVVEPHARFAAALIGDPERAKEVTIEGLEDVRIAAVQAIRVAGETCRPALVEGRIARIGYTSGSVAAIVNTIDVFTKARAELRLGMANFAIRSTPADVKSMSDRAEQLQRVANRFNQVVTARIDELRALERADLIEDGLANLIAYRESQRARLLAAREAITTPLDARSESEDLKTFARRAMAYVRKALIPLVSTHIVSAKTRDNLTASVDEILAANEVVVSPVRELVVGAGATEAGFNKAIRDSVVELLNHGTVLRQQETALKAKIGTVEKALIESSKHTDADRPELVRAAQEAIRGSEELARIGVTVSDALASEMADIRRNAELATQRFAGLL